MGKIESYYYYHNYFERHCPTCFHEKFWAEILISKYLIIQLPAVCISAALYLMVILQLRRGQTNARKRNLTLTFIVLWALWVTFSTPYAVCETYVRLEINYFGPMDSMYVLNRVMTKVNNKLGFHSQLRSQVVVEYLLFTLKQSFAFFNSLVLIVLIRYFRETWFYKSIKKVLCLPKAFLLKKRQ